jgi:hypothetical protein
MDNWKPHPFGGEIRRNAAMHARLTIGSIGHDGIVTVGPMTLELEPLEDTERIVDEVETRSLALEERGHSRSNVVRLRMLRTFILKKTSWV